jgi:hypothetical protein
MKVGGICRALVLLAAFPACGLQVLNTYNSPRNSEREARNSTRYIILHTTEAPGSSALPKLSACGEANFGVDVDGRVYRIVDHRRTAFHCGRSMWNGHANMDDCAIGIEVVGYHNRDVTRPQYQALAALLKELQGRYHIPDERVLTHSMVAYGAPNKWITRSHRGRKRCGMLFARWNVRQKLGLTRKPRFDPDVRAGRLINGDLYLANVLYGNAPEQERLVAQAPKAAPNVVSAGNSVWEIARDAYRRADTIYVFPDGTRRAGNQIRDWKGVPQGTRVLVADTGPAADSGSTADEVQVIGVDGSSAAEIAGDEAGCATTFYFLANGRYVRGSQLSPQARERLPAGTRMLVGYSVIGPASAPSRAQDLCGRRWRLPDTYYLLEGGVLRNGREIGVGALNRGTVAFCRD